MDDPKEWQVAVEDHEKTKGNDDDNDGFLVYKQNWEAVIVFCNLRNCWRTDAWVGRCLGLDRQAIESTLRLMAIDQKLHQEIFAKLMIMEDAAMEILNKK